ncbi:MAG: hypothetical protein EOO50_06550 [Flavobacterium sp.]|uniref:epimerase n=1 Tax=Flavobacterium sp. TaxID=239 RepID=UPI001211BEE2|nr:epimerase [Flavobacterium sp.]RZJ67178.1 MAG: hypothetical protein EOO50_06550 [Flavobacterium sp.]
MSLKVIITGATGMVGEGVFLDCLENPEVSHVLIINRKHYDLEHPKLKELLVPDFFELDRHSETLKGYDACFFCAGISSFGMSEEKFTKITYDTTLSFAKTLVAVNPQMVFTYVSGLYTDSSEKGKVMWARVKGKTENDLIKLPFKGVYAFRPGAMLPVKDQKNWKLAYEVLTKIIRFFAPKNVLSLHEVGRAMVNVCKKGYPKKVLEIADIKQLST